MLRNPAANRILKLLTWPAAFFVAGILLWYEQYKLTGHPGSTFLFTVLTDWLGLGGHEKAMRLLVAIAEIMASVLVVIPATRLLGALGSLALMSGAIFFHLVSPLGIDPYNDGGGLFTEACEVWLASVFILFAYRDELAALARPILSGRIPPLRSALVH